jgi:hypothetical protein
VKRTLFGTVRIWLLDGEVIVTATLDPGTGCVPSEIE